MEQRLTRPNPFPDVSVKLIVGLFFTALGIVLTLDNLRLIDGHAYLRFWPVVLVAIGVVKTIDATTRAIGLVWLVIGGALLAITTRFMRVSLFDLWPLLLIAIGGIIVARGFGIRPQAALAGSDGTICAILTQRKVSVDAKNFTGARVVAVLGACELDLTNADIEKGPAVIEVLALMGGIEMRVPDGWEVVGDAVPVMGGIEIKTRSKRTGRQLVLRGFVMMGGVDVKDAAARQAA